MSTNCISCVVNKRTGPDLLCDSCREAKKTLKDCPICGSIRSMEPRGEFLYCRNFKCEHYEKVEVKNQDLKESEVMPNATTREPSNRPSSSVGPESKPQGKLHGYNPEKWEEPKGEKSIVLIWNDKGEFVRKVGQPPITPKHRELELQIHKMHPSEFLKKDAVAQLLASAYPAHDPVKERLVDTLKKARISVEIWNPSPDECLDSIDAALAAFQAEKEKA